jgi:hypothetical protein
VTQFEHPMTCPHCHKAQPLAAPADDSWDLAPKDGDASLCFDCGKVGIFDSASPGGARLPTDEEAAEMDRDAGIQLLRLGWVLKDVSLRDLFAEAST